MTTTNTDGRTKTMQRLQTPICDRLRLEFPVSQVGMGWWHAVSRPRPCRKQVALASSAPVPR